MNLLPFHLIWAKEPVEFASDYNWADSIDRMKKATSRRIQRSVDPTKAYARTPFFLGKVSEKKVQVHPHPQWPPSGSDGLATPWFQGHFVTSDGKVILKGCYSSYILDKVIATVFFGLLIIAFLGGLGSLVRYGIAKPGAFRALGLMIGSSAFFVGGAWVFKAQQTANRAPQIALLSERLRKALKRTS